MNVTEAVKRMEEIDRWPLETVEHAQRIRKAGEQLKVAVFQSSRIDGATRQVVNEWFDGLRPRIEEKLGPDGWAKASS